MPKGDFKSITVTEFIYDRFNDNYKKNKDDLKMQGINSFTAYIVNRLEEAHRTNKTKMRFNVINCVELGKLDIIVMYDNWNKELVEITSSSSTLLFCKRCEKENCLHVGFAMSLHQAYIMKVKRN